LQRPILRAGGCLRSSIDPLQVLVEPPRAEGRLSEERHGRGGQSRSRAQETDRLLDLVVALGVFARLAEEAAQMQEKLAANSVGKLLLVEQRSHDVRRVFLGEGVESRDQELDREPGTPDRRERLDGERLL
jgi:hypothetical protein